MNSLQLANYYIKNKKNLWVRMDTKIVSRIKK